MFICEDAFDYFSSNINKKYLQYLGSYYDNDEFAIIFNGSPIIYLYENGSVYFGYLNDPIFCYNVETFSDIKDTFDVIIKHINDNYPYEHLITLGDRYFGFWNVVRNVDTGMVYK